MVAKGSEYRADSLIMIVLNDVSEKTLYLKDLVALDGEFRFPGHVEGKNKYALVSWSMMRVTSVKCLKQSPRLNFWKHHYCLCMMDII